MKEIGILKINERADKIEGCIRFDKGSAKFPFPEEFLPLVEEVKEEIRGKYFHYPKVGGEEKLKEQIAKFEERNGREISPKEIVITHGGMSGLFSSFYLLSKPGDEVITNRYCFEGFSLLIDHFGLIQKRVDLSKIGEIEKAITSRTKIIVLNSPENPTGKVYSKEEIEGIVELAKKKNLWVISDEVMNQIVYGGKKWYGPSLKNDNVLVINSFSKIWFIPGVRVGWIATRDRRLIEELSNFISLQSLGVNLFGQLLMEKVLKEIDLEEFLKKRIEVLERRKKIFEQALEKYKIEPICKVEGGMNFYLNLKEDTQKLAEKLLEKFKVAIIPGYFFEGKPSTFARLGFGAVNEEEILKGIEIISSVIKS
jgi:aspartate aminotransferase